MHTLPNLDSNAPWKQRFRAPRIAWARLANLDSRRGLVCTDRDGLLQLYAWQVASGELQQLTDEPAGVTNGLISADGEAIYYLRDQGGDEVGHYVRLPFTGGAPEDVTPDLPLYGSYDIHQSFFGEILGARVADESGLQLMVFKPGEHPRVIHRTRQLFSSPSFSSDGAIVVVATTEGMRDLDKRLLAIDVATGQTVAELWEGEGISHEAGEFSPLPGDYRMLTSTSASGYARPLIWNPRTGEWRHLLVEKIPGELEAWTWSRDGRRVLLSQLYQAQRQLYLYDLQRDRVSRLSHPPGVVGGYGDNGQFTEDGRILITWQDPAHPSRLIALDGASGRHLETVLPAGEVPAGRSWQPVTFPSENGAPLHAWLAVPPGSGPFPTILHTHGGPTAVMSDTFSPESQAWLDHGFAFLSLNYHGSTTFGKAFEKAIFGRLGELETRDMAAAYHWLVANEIARPDAVFLTGDSYGGYLTLQALGVRPDLWAGGMAGVAIADWTMLYEDESETLRSYQVILFDGTPEEKPEAYRQSSPITYTNQVQAPILVIQGSNDTRCPSRQMLAYESRLQEAGKPISVHWFEAGHGSLAQEQRIEHQAIKLRFVYDILG